MQHSATRNQRMIIGVSALRKLTLFLQNSTLSRDTLRRYQTSAYAQDIADNYDNQPAASSGGNHYGGDFGSSSMDTGGGFTRPFGRGRGRVQFNEFGEQVQQQAFGASPGMQRARGRGRGRGRGGGRGRFKSYLPSIDLKPGDWLCPQCQCSNYRYREQCLNCGVVCQSDFQRWSYDDGTPWKPPPPFEPKPGDWKCVACTKWNFRDKSCCFFCGSQCTEACEYIPLPQPKKGEFYCRECNTLNFAMRSKCIRCDTERPLSAGPACGTARGDWYCSDCGNKNMRSRERCFRCDCVLNEHARIEGSCASSVQQGDWVCPECLMCNMVERKACVRCKSSQPLDNRVILTAEAFEALPGDWVCNKCLVANHRSEKQCFLCTTKRSVDCHEIAYDEDLSKMKRQAIPFDWECPKCNRYVFSFNTTCPRCPDSCKLTENLIQPKAWKDAQLGDWRCDSCGCVTDSHRIKCYHCSADRSTHAECVSVAVQMGNFFCMRCDKWNLYFRADCKECGAARSLGEKPALPQQWVCADCQTLNLSWLENCFSCHASRKDGIFTSSS